MITQFRTVWRKSWHDNDRKTIWRSNLDEHDRNVESLRQCGHLVLREERREVALVVPQVSGRWLGRNPQISNIPRGFLA